MRVGRCNIHLEEVIAVLLLNLLAMVVWTEAGSTLVVLVWRDYCMS